MRYGNDMVIEIFKMDRLKFINKLTLLLSRIEQYYSFKPNEPPSKEYIYKFPEVLSIVNEIKTFTNLIPVINQEDTIVFTQAYIDNMNSMWKKHNPNNLQ